jgi:hypothetical protein
MVMMKENMVNMVIDDGVKAGWLGFDYQQGQEIFLYFVASRLALGPTQSPLR